MRGKVGFLMCVHRVMVCWVKFVGGWSMWKLVIVGVILIVLVGCEMVWGVGCDL